jgi:hypothetical protein
VVAGREIDVRNLGLEADLTPSASMLARMFSTMLTRRKVPMCGLLT